ncbi:outer membrane beta-barrel family protein [Maribellus sediminis]|uniref:outer membrane beta-barrel family protein n=1 Tax=Maribellus sediminis TaxID=2696285 RepID=UPI0014321D9F|nr:outer membrane beta-barrel family protein [Maribellus sediminis]
MKYFTFLVFSLLTFISQAQNSRIIGRVTDALSDETLEYASVSVYRTNDSSLVTGAITGTSGSFELKNLEAGNYYIQVQFLGYETKSEEGIQLAAGQKFEIGTVKLNPAQQLVDEVNVTGNRINAMNKVDKQTFDAAQFESAKGGSAVDVLRNMPSVAVNAEGEILVRGTGGFLLLLDGKPVLSDPSSVLSRIPANAVKNVELITTPSAKYDPDGTAGIINITTKNASSLGTGVVVNAKYGLPGFTDFGNDRVAKRYGGDMTLTYQKEKWDITLGGNYNRNDLAGYREGNVEIKNYENNTLSKMPSEGERSFNRYDYALRAAIQYKMNKSNTLSANIYTGKKYQERDANLFYSNSKWTLDTNEKISDSPYYNANKQIKQGTFTLGDIDFTHVFENESSLALSFLYEYDDLYGTTHNRNLTEPGGEIIQYVQNPYQKPVEGYRAKIDYAVNIGKGKLESGYQYRKDSQDGIFDYSVEPMDPNYDQRFSGSALSENTINSAYSQYSVSQEKWEYIVGLRYEYSRRSVKLSYESEEHIQELSNLFPTANAQYSLRPDLKFKAGFSRRIQRSNNNQLNPIPEREHSETLEMGDPDLKPELISLGELGLVKTFEDGGSLFFTAYFRLAKDPVQRVNSVFNDSILYRVYTNVERGQAYGIELGADLHPTKWWDLYFGGNLNNQSFTGDLKILDEPVLNVDNSRWVYSINFNSTVHFSSTLSLNGNVNFLSKRPTPQGEDSRYLIPNLSLKKTFLDKRLTATIQWQNIDLGMKESHRQRITTWGDDFYTTTNYIYETDFVMLNLSYNFNWKNGKAKLPSTEFGEKEF